MRLPGLRGPNYRGDGLRFANSFAKPQPSRPTAKSYKAARLVRQPGLIDKERISEVVPGRTMAIPQLLVHDKKDTVGVVVVEGLKKGTDMLCVVTHDNSSFKLKSKMDVPIGHKVALTDINKGDTIWKYGQDIGIAKAKIGKGEHVHVHNVKTKRW
jgi:(2R)-sulfolactate sulfo-lyase subunit alpha